MTRQEPVVFVLQYSHKHGEDFCAFSTLEGAIEAAADLAQHYADQAGDKAGEIRELFAAGKFQDCVDLYLDGNDIECMDIHVLNIQGVPQ